MNTTELASSEADVVDVSTEAIDERFVLAVLAERDFVALSQTPLRRTVGEGFCPLEQKNGNS